MLTGGLVANILLAASGKEIGSGSMEFILKSNYGEYINKAGMLYERYAQKIRLPEDVAFLKDGQRCEALADAIPANATVLDIGSRAAKRYADVILASKTVFVNGPMGVFEQPETELGTKVVWDALGDTQAYTVVGGGDSITATSKYGKTELISYICTGGGALIRFLTGEELPVVKALRHAATAFPIQ